MAGVDAFGTTWSYSTNGGTTYIPVADVTEVSILDVSVETIETTTHGSPNGWRTFVGGVKDGGELKMSVNYDPALHASIYATIGSDTLKHKIVIPDAGLADVVFTGIVTGFSAGAPYDDKLSAEITIKVSGELVITL